MWFYKVIHSFKDLQDNEHIYKVGDIYPRQGVHADKERINELKTAKNKIGKPLIKAERISKEG
jgi:hypothetical protein